MQRRGKKYQGENRDFHFKRKRPQIHCVGLLYACSESIVNRSPTACIQLFTAVDGFLWSFFVGWLLFISWSLVCFCCCCFGVIVGGGDGGVFCCCF